MYVAKNILKYSIIDIYNTLYASVDELTDIFCDLSQISPFLIRSKIRARIPICQ